MKEVVDELAVEEGPMWRVVRLAVGLSAAQSMSRLGLLKSSRKNQRELTRKPGAVYFALSGGEEVISITSTASVLEGLAFAAERVEVPSFDEVLARPRILIFNRSPSCCSYHRLSALFAQAS